MNEKEYIRKLEDDNARISFLIGKIHVGLNFLVGEACCPDIKEKIVFLYNMATESIDEIFYKERSSES